MKGYVSVCPFDYLIAMKCQQNLCGAVGNRTYRVRVNAVGNRNLPDSHFGRRRFKTRTDDRCGWKPNEIQRLSKYRVGVHAVRLETEPTGPGEKYRITEVFTEHAYYFKITIFRVAE